MKVLSQVLTSLSVLVPTASGVVLYMVISGLTLLIHEIPGLQHYLDIPTNLHIRTQLLSFLSTVLMKLFGGQLDTIVLSVFWMLVGLIVYLFLKFIISFIVEVGRDIFDNAQNLQPASQEKPNTIRHLLERTLFRVTTFIVTVFYAIWAIGFFLHGSANSASGLGQNIANYPVWRMLELFVGECIALYGMTVLIRLILLRPRISFS